MKSEYLRTLVESIATGSFSRASENLFISQSAVSRRIKFLEEQYGYSLIDRSGPVLTATEVGQIVIEKAKQMLSLEKELMQDLQLIFPSPNITFCCTPAFGIVYLTDIMKNFMLANPDTTELRFFFDMPGKVVDGLHEGKFQVGVIEYSEEIDLTEFKTFELPSDEAVFVSAPQIGLAAEKLCIDQLISYDLYTRKEGCCSSKLLETNMKRLGRDCAEFNRVIYYEDLHMIIDAVREGAGIAFVPRPVVEKLVSEGALYEHRADNFQHEFRRTLMVSNSMSPATAARVDSFVSCVLSAFSGAPVVPAVQQPVNRCF
jgi:DNA-binding transcriptional LysR family regulator